MRFDARRHNDPKYDAPAPWTEWDSYANCWCCKVCGSAAGYQIHNPGCYHEQTYASKTACDRLDDFFEDLDEKT